MHSSRKGQRTVAAAAVAAAAAAIEGGADARALHELRFEVYDWNAVSSNTFLGMVAFDGGGLEEVSSPIKAYHTLQKRPGATKKQSKYVKGQLGLSIELGWASPRPHPAGWAWDGAGHKGRA